MIAEKTHNLILLALLDLVLLEIVDEKITSRQLKTLGKKYLTNQLY